jgi:hypothetical protein
MFREQPSWAGCQVRDEATDATDATGQDSPRLGLRC